MKALLNSCKVHLCCIIILSVGIQQVLNPAAGTNNKQVNNNHHHKKVNTPSLLLYAPASEVLAPCSTQPPQDGPHHPCYARSMLPLVSLLVELVPDLRHPCCPAWHSALLLLLYCRHSATSSHCGPQLWVLDLGCLGCGAVCWSQTACLWIHLSLSFALFSSAVLFVLGLGPGCHFQIFGLWSHLFYPSLPVVLFGWVLGPG